jgi:hypothetical protein
MKLQTTILLTVKEIAALLAVKPSWVYANAEKLLPYRIGKYLRFSADRTFAALERSHLEGPSPGSQPNDPPPTTEFTPQRNDSEQQRNRTKALDGCITPSRDKGGPRKEHI